MHVNDPSRGFTKVDLLLVVAVLFVLAWVLLPPRAMRVRSGRIQCVNNLKNVGLALRIFSSDHADRYPPEVMLSNGVKHAEIDIFSVYCSITNQLSNPSLLYCPDDKKRTPAKTFSSLTTKNLSYFLSLTAAEPSPNVFLAGDRNLQTNGVAVTRGLLLLTTNSVVSWSKDIHVDHGNILMADGSVQQFSSSRLSQGVRNQELATNYLAIP